MMVMLKLYYRIEGFYQDWFCFHLESTLFIDLSNEWFFLQIVANREDECLERQKHNDQDENECFS